MPDKEISMTIRQRWTDSKKDVHESVVKYVRRKKESDKHFRKRMRKMIVSLKADIVEHEVKA